MKKHLSAFSTLIFFCGLSVFTFFSCKSKPVEIDPEFAKYISAFTYGNISPESYIQIELADEMPSVELNTEVKEKMFSFSPSIKGKTYWINSSTIRFIPDAGELKPGKDYTGKFFLSKVMKVKGKFKTFKFPFKVNEQNFSVNVFPYSQMNSSDLKWNSVDVMIKLSNSAKIDDVQKMVGVSGAPKQTKVRITQINNTQFRATIDSLPRTDELSKYELTVSGKPIGVSKDVKSKIEIQPLSTDKFEVIDVQLQQEASPYIRITFDDPIAQSQDIQGLITPSNINNFTYQIDKNVIKIFPEKLPEGNLTVQVNQGIKNNKGVSLSKTYTFQLNVQGTKPEVKFEKNGNILPNAKQLNLPFSAVNLWAVDVKVIKVYQTNILYYLQTNTLSNNENQEELRRFGRLIMKKRLRLDADKTLDLSKWNKFNIDLSPLFKKDPGALYIVQLTMKKDYSLYRCGGNNPVIPEKSSMNDFSDEVISDEDEATWDEPTSYYSEDIDWENYSWDEKDDPCTESYYMDRNRETKTMVMASNIGIIAKGSNDNKMTVAATDILTTDPISGAKVNVYSYQMQLIGTVETDGDGFAEIDCKKIKPFIATVAKGKDIGYLEVKDELSLSLSNFDISGKEIQKGLKGYLYGERGIWRPGDTIHLSFILEDKLQKLPEGHPVTLEVYTPKRQFFLRETKTSGINGFYTFNIATLPTSETGTWQAYVKVGGTSFYKPLHIETIKPNRLKVRLETDSIIDASKGTFAGVLNSQWLQGAPASNLKADVELTLSKTENPFKNFKGYSFNNPLVKFESNKYTIFDGILNGAGTANINSNIPVAETAPGMLKGSLLSRVYEPGGDVSFYTQTVFYSPYATYVGIQSPAERNGELLETDKPLTFNVVTVNARGQRVAKPSVQYSIFKLDWSWWWSSSSEDLGSFVNNTAVRPLANGSVSLKNGMGQIGFQVNYPDWGRYLIVARDGDGHISGTVFYVDWPSWRGRSNKSDPNGLTMLSFSTDKQTYSVGEEATVIIPKSSAGRALISIENGSHIIQREWVKTSAKEDTKYKFKVTEEMNPNFYVFATLLQPHAQKDNDLPIRMYGVLNINVEDKNSILTPVINMPSELRPEKEFSVSVSEKTGKPMTYTLAIVDEGLLDITAFKTPNAWDEFYSKEALGVRTWDLFDRVISANTGLLGPLLSIGGDEALKSSSDRANRFKPVVKFIGPFTIKGGQSKVHKIKMSAYVGSVRVMVVAGGNGAYGSAEKTVPVRNPLMTLSTLPRVMGPGEEVYLPVNVFAMNKKVKNVQVSIQTKGLLRATDGVVKSVTFDKVGDKVLFFKLKAINKIGTERVVIKSVGNGESFVETIDIGIRNPNPPMVISQTAFIDAGKTANLSLKTDNIQAKDWVKLEISRFPSMNLNKNLAYLLEYPHGCSEQVTSQGFPMLYLSEFLNLSDVEKKQASDKVTNAIRILLSRQLPDGGFAYWSGDSYATEWVSSYVGHFLIEAKSKGYEVADNVINRWVQFQQKTARNWTPTNPYRGYYGMSMTELQQAYRLYTLALSGNTELGAMNRMRELKDLPVQAKWQLASAYALSGKKNVANELIFNVSNKIADYSFNNDTYGSSARDEAMIMDTYLLLGQTEKAYLLAQTVSQALSNDYISTQTASFGLVAMSKLAKKMGKGNIDINWSVNGKRMPSISTPQSVYNTGLTPTINQSVNITNRGKGRIYARLTAFTQPMQEIAQASKASFGISVKYTDKNGNPIDVKTLKQGTEFYATVMVQNGNTNALTDLALVQIFPSGWEIFNERVMNSNSVSTENYNYRDIRDDRMLTYFNLDMSQTKAFNVRLQASYKGVYYLPAISCEAMYAPVEQARTSGMWVTVN